MKILLINKFHYLVGGVERYLFECMDLFNRKGHTVISFSMDHSRNEKSEYGRFFVPNVEYTETTKGMKRLLYGLRSIYSITARKNISALIKHVKPDIAHVQCFCYQLTPSILYPLKACGIPVLHTAHEYKFICPNQRLYNLHTGRICELCKNLRFYRPVSERCIKNSIFTSALGSIEAYLYKYLRAYEKMIDAIITPSVFLKNKLIEFGFDRIPIFHLPNFISLDKYEPGDSNGDYILYFGRLSKNKGLATLCRAMKRLDRVILKIAGDGEYEGDLQHLIRSEKLENVELIGYNANKALIELIKGSICTIIPSEWYENCPFSVLESFALGKPVIGANIGGIPELIDDGVDGFLFEPGDVAGLAYRIQYMIKNKNKAKMMGKIGRRKIERKYSADQHYGDLLGLYKRTIARYMK